METITIVHMESSMTGGLDAATISSALNLLGIENVIMMVKTEHENTFNSDIELFCPDGLGSGVMLFRGNEGVGVIHEDEKMMPNG